MAFQHSPALPRQVIQNISTSPESSTQVATRPNVEESQEWILFSPSQADSSTNRTRTSQTAGLSRVSDLGSLNTAARSGRLESTVLDEEDAELDSLDEGLHAFQQPSFFPIPTNQTQGAVLPTHDGLGTFPASSPPVLEQLWQHEQFNPKRKHEGYHRRTSSIQRRLDVVDDLEAQAGEEKRMRIEKWRIEQSQALMQEVERETRKQMRRESLRRGSTTLTIDDGLGTTPKQSDFMPKPVEETTDAEPFWRRITRRFIRDVIGIDDPLLSVILGESLPEEALEQNVTTTLPTILEQVGDPDDVNQEDGWRDRLLQRIARELGVYAHQLSPHPGAFSTYHSLSKSPDYAGMPVTVPASQRTKTSLPVANGLPKASITSTLTPNFPPTIQDPVHAENWGFEEEPVSSSSTHPESALDLQREREYWERELDLKMVFRYLRNRFSRGNSEPRAGENAPHPTEDAAKRTAIIRQHHPLVARAQKTPVRLRRDSRLASRRPTSSCASESVKSSRKASVARSGSSSRNYWDIGGSVGSGSIMASGGLMGAWGEV